MDSRRKLTAFSLALVVVFMVALIAAIPAPVPAEAAPAAAITPVASITDRGGNARVLTFFDAEAITADTRHCFDVADYELMDVQYLIDVGTVNTTTLKIQHTNISPSDSDVVYTDGDTIASAITADGNALTQRALFGRWNCVLADVTNSNTITITAIGVAK